MDRWYNKRKVTCMEHVLLEHPSLCCLTKLPLGNLPVQCLLCIALTTRGNVPPCSNVLNSHLP